MRRKECKPGERALCFAGAQANTSAFEGILLDGGYDRARGEDRARTDSGRAGEHLATLQGAGLNVRHRIAPFQRLERRAPGKIKGALVAAQLLGIAAAIEVKRVVHMP